ncbi:hypothetical protein [Arcticibacter sp. MXS-1]|uniref:hypothetical protein n=1 Tax=Arcticibacter sp. MXS-1 TaxID=3341726 RepID=UPI0035A97C74
MDIVNSGLKTPSAARTPVSRGASTKLKAQASYSLLKRGIWMYFLLLIFEGALRKWVFPGLATPLLVVRDPIAIWLVFACWKEGLLPRSGFLIATLLVSIMAFFTALLAGHGNFLVAFFGARVFLFHFPLIYVIGRVFNQEDVIKMGRATLMLSIPMALLVALQFYSPQSAWVNRGVGGVETAGFTGALGYSRPPGTFSFTNGNSLFYGFAAGFVFYFWLRRENINKLVLTAATFALLIVIPLSISRGLFFTVVVCFLFVVLASVRNPRFLSQMVIAVIVASLAFLLLSQLSFFQTSIEAFTSRFNGANESEGGLEGVLVDRYLGGMIAAFSLPSGLAFWGTGMGAYSNVGTMLLAGQVVSAVSEGEWGRMIQELGPMLGLTIVFVRLGVSAQLSMMAYSRLKKRDVLPWILLSFSLLNFPQGNWAQPTSLGFCILSTGLVLASFRPSAGVDVLTRDSHKLRNRHYSK